MSYGEGSKNNKTSYGVSYSLAGTDYDIMVFMAIVSVGNPSGSDNRTKYIVAKLLFAFFYPTIYGCIWSGLGDFIATYEVATVGASHKRDYGIKIDRPWKYIESDFSFWFDCFV